MLIKMLLWGVACGAALGWAVRAGAVIPKPLDDYITLRMHDATTKTLTTDITYLKVGQWNTAYGWGNHALAGYLLSSSLASEAMLESQISVGVDTSNDSTVTHSRFVGNLNGTSATLSGLTAARLVKTNSTKGLASLSDTPVTSYTLIWNGSDYVHRAASGISGIPVGANPSASVNGTATNGSAATWTRSDGAPALADPFTPADGTQNITGGLTTSAGLAGSTVTLAAGGAVLSPDYRVWDSHAALGYGGIVVQNRNANTGSIFYVVPKGTVAPGFVDIAKIEMFATDYFADPTNYTGLVMGPGVNTPYHRIGSNHLGTGTQYPIRIQMEHAGTIDYINAQFNIDGSVDFPAGLVRAGAGTPGVANGTGDLYASDALEVDGVSNLAGAVTAGSSIAATGNIKSGAGTATIATGSGEIYATGDLEADGNLDIAGNIAGAGTNAFSGITKQTGGGTNTGNYAVSDLSLALAISCETTTATNYANDFRIGTTSAGALTNAAGPRGNAWVFDGSTAVHFGNNYNETTNDFTIAFWIKMATPGATALIVDKRTGDFATGFCIYGKTDGTWAVGLGDGTHTVEGALGTSGALDNTWHHCAFVFARAGVCTYYLDGISNGTRTISTVTGSVSDSNNYYLGSLRDGSSFKLTASIDEYMHWSRALTVAEVRSLVNQDAVWSGRDSTRIRNMNSDKSVLSEMTIAPSNPLDGAQAQTYMKGDKFIIAYNDSGTMKYRYLDLTSTDATWTYTTTAP